MSWRWGWCVAVLLGATSAFAAPVHEWLSPPGHVSEAPISPTGSGVETQRLRQQIDELARESEELRAITIARGRAYVRLSRAGLMPLSGGFDALDAHASRLQRLQRALARDLARDRQLDARRLAALRLLQELEAAPPSSRVTESRARDAIAAAEEREQAFQRAFESNYRPAAATVYAAEATPVMDAAGFAAQRGRLPFPVVGRSEIRKLRSPSGAGKALLLHAQSGTLVRAVYPGRVAFADDYPDLGKTVIIDHGDRFYSVSAHLDRISVRAGDELSSGQRIGTVGIYERQPGLLFEIRAGQSTVDTPAWFGI